MGLFGDVLGGLGGFGGSLAVMLGAAGKGGKGSLQQSVGLWDKIQQPNFDFRDLTFPELQQLSEYSPELVNAIIPKDVQQVLDSPEARAQQVGALGQLNAIGSQGGLALEDRLASQEAQRAMATQAQRDQGSVMRNLAQRGALGGGDEIQARLLGNQQASEMGRGMASDLTRQAMDRRLGAIQSSAGLAGQIRSSDQGLSAQNAGITNRFNELAANIQNQAAQFNAQAKTTAQGQNAATKQRIGETNLAGQYQNQQGNLQRQNDLRQQQYDNQIRKTAGQSNALQGLAQGQYAEQSARGQNIQSLGRGAGQAVGGGLDLANAGGAFGADLQSANDPFAYLRKRY